MVLLSCRTIGRFPSLLSLFSTGAAKAARYCSCDVPCRIARKLGGPSDLAALQDGVDVALSLARFDATSRNDLVYEIVPALERGQVLLGEFAPLGSDFLANDLRGRGGRIGGLGIAIGMSLGGCRIRG